MPWSLFVWRTQRLIAELLTLTPRPHRFPFPPPLASSAQMDSSGLMTTQRGSERSMPCVPKENQPLVDWYHRLIFLTLIYLTYV